MLQEEGEKDMKRVRMDTYPVASVLVNELMKAIMDEVHSTEVCVTSFIQSVASFAH